MPWTPALPEVDFGLPLLDNLKTVIVAHQTAALAWAASLAPAEGPLEDFVRILKCERVSKHFPALSIFPVGDAPEMGAEGASFDHHCVFGFEVAVTNRKPESLTEELRKRVAAVRMLVLSASQADLLTGIQNATRLLIELGPAQFEQVREHKETAGLYYRSAFFTITFQYVQIGG